ncbi:hypothetical protein [Bdellovibrio sp. GT3]|uniref:hypothetical protein n=1 Tax=Bdellovibrio sp. GT3 TaxID=3136282 RepID=UPI0030F13CE5
MKLKIALIAASTLAFSIASAENVAVINGKKYTCKDGASLLINNGVAICDGEVIQPDAASEEIAADVIDSALQKKPSIKIKKSGTKKAQPPVGRMDAETLKKKTFQAVNNTVSAEEFPQKCIIKYSIASKETTRKGGVSKSKDPTKEKMAIFDKGIADGLSPEEILAKVKAYDAKNTGAETSQQLTATLLYRSGGVIKKETILDLQTSVENASDLLGNMKDVMVDFNDRYCKEFRADTESEDSAPTQNNTNSNSNKGNSRPAVQ